nr:isocitrate lyase/phosphoenolpyruvate mutase family protein [uncultured Shimia sp.]
MQDTQTKFANFKALHTGKTAFVMPNPWDAGSARLLESLGFDALATTSAGYAFSKGKRDSVAGLTRREILENAVEIVDATDLPVSADLEDGFGATPDICADTIYLASQAGLVGGSIEDASGNADQPIFDFQLSVDRIRAAAETAQELPFLLTARAENFLWGNPDLKDTIKRLQAYSDAGADVLYAPGLPDLTAIREVCQSVDKPVNVVMGLGSATYSLEDLSHAGVARVSVGGSLARTAFGAILRAACEIRENGTFHYSADAIPDSTISQLMKDTKGRDRI